jgi:hypothetical protein
VSALTDVAWFASKLAKGDVLSLNLTVVISVNIKSREAVVRARHSRVISTAPSASRVEIEQHRQRVRATKAESKADSNYPG